MSGHPCTGGSSTRCVRLSRLLHHQSASESPDISRNPVPRSLSKCLPFPLADEGDQESSVPWLFVMAELRRAGLETWAHLSLARPLSSDSDPGSRWQTSGAATPE